MKWRLFANLGEIAGENEIEVGTEPGETFRDALDALFEAHPELESEVMNDEGMIYDHIRVLRNGENPFVKQDGFETELEEGDELALFPPVSGG